MSRKTAIFRDMGIF